MASIVREDAVYKRLGSHPLILNYDGKVFVNENVYSLKIERALGCLRTFALNCLAPGKETRLAMAYNPDSFLIRRNYSIRVEASLAEISCDYVLNQNPGNPPCFVLRASSLYSLHVHTKGCIFQVTLSLPWSLNLLSAYSFKRLELPVSAGNNKQTARVQSSKASKAVCQ